MKKFLALSFSALIATGCFAQMGVGTTSPNSTLDIRGSLSTSYRSFASATSATISDNTLVYTGTTAVALTLPDAATCQGRVYWIKNVSSNSSPLTINTTSSQTIDGLSSWVLPQMNKSVQLISNGTNWYVSAESIPGSSGISSAWTPGGNAVASAQTLGTTSAFDLPIITNNVERMRLMSGGNVGIGTSNPSTKLHIYGTNPLTLTGVVVGTATTADSLLTITAGLVRKLPMATFATPANSWSITGNSGTTVNNYIGTTTNIGFRIKTGTTAIQGLLVDSLGNVAVGKTPGFTAMPAREKFLVDAGTTTSINAISAKGSIDNYLQLNIQNQSSGANASSDIVATSSAGNESINFVDMGINGGGNTANIFGRSNDAYLYNQGENFFIANSTPNKSLILMTGGTDSATYERMRIDGSGNVGIGTANPQSELHVNGINPLTLTGVQLGTANATDSVLTLTNGLVRKLPISTFAGSGTNWSTTGNAGTTSANFLGTTDNQSLRFRTNNIQQMKIDSATGNVAIGQDTFDINNPEKLVVNAGITTSVNAFLAKGSIDNYFQINVKNQSTGANATSDLVATADNGTESSNYVDLGINGSNYSGSAIQTGTANDGYLISSGRDFYMVNSSPNKAMLFLTGGTGVANERMRILANGRVGMGVQDPTAPFVVKDTMEIRRVGPLSQLLFTNTGGSGDFRIGGDGGDLYWQGGGSRNLQMGSYWTTILGGDRQISTYPAFQSAQGGTGVLVVSQRDASVPLGVQANSGSQSANLTEWRNSGGSVLSSVNNNGYFGIGTSNPTTALSVTGTNPLTLLGVQTGTTTSADSLLTITGGLVKKLPLSTFATSATSWATTGNAGTSSINNFIGTTDNQSFKIKANNLQGIVVDSLGSVGIGASPTFTSGTYREKFLVDAGTTTSYNPMVVQGSIDSFFQFNIQNLSPGTHASSDIVATSNSGTQTSYFVDMGINGSGNTSNIFGKSNDAYLYNAGENFFIATSSPSKSLLFLTGGTDSATNERMRIDGNGNVGIGTPNPLNKLHVSAAADPLYLGGVQSGTNTDSVLTIKNGVVKRLSPASLTVSSSNAWALVGNSNTLASNYFLGTTNTDPLIIKVNNAPAGRIDLVNTFLGYQAGYNNGSTANQSTGIGYHALTSNSTGTYNTALGYNALPNTTSGSYNVGIGYNADAGGANSNSVAIGANSYVSYSNAIALGTSASAFNTYATAIGANTYSSGTNSIAIGAGASTNKTQAQGTSSIALGYSVYSGGINTIAIGSSANTSATNAVVIGNGSYTGQANAIILGDASNNSVNVGLGTSSPSAKLHINATAGNNPLIMQGLASGATTDNILTINPSTGVVNSLSTSTLSPWYYGGNPVTAAKTIGTTTNYDLPFITNNTEKMRLSAGGNLGIGNTVVDGVNAEKLLVDAGSSSYNVISGKGNLNNYLQLNIKNSNAGTTASSDVVATNDAGTEANGINFVDMGVNSSGNASTGVLGGANTGYLYSTGSDFSIGNATSAKSLLLFTGGTASSNERMRVDGNGNVGINNVSPSQKLDVTGNFKLAGAFMPGGTAGNLGEFLVSSGANASPTWFNATPFVGTVAWVKAGNAGTSANTDFLGTTDNQSLKIKTNNAQAVYVDSLGNVGIGRSPAFTTGTYREKFLVDAGTTSSYNPMVVQGSIDSFFQFNIQNFSTGTHASSDIVATSNSGTQTSNFVDMGINGSANTSNIFGKSNDAYLYNSGENFFIATSSPNKALVLMTGGTDSASNERVHIDGSGNVGIGTGAPAATLDVKGTTKIGATGTAINSMLRATVNIGDGLSLAAGVTGTYTASITNSLLYASVILNPRASLPSGIAIAWARISSAGTLTVGLVNDSTGPISIPSQQYDVTLIQ